MRHRSEFPQYVEVRNDSPAGSSDDVTRITRRNGRVYEVSVNERYGTVGVCEVIEGNDGTEKFVDVTFAQGDDAQTFINERTENLYSPAYIVRIALESAAD